jgi:GNAT superfamily N-acetyltransferase
MKAGDEGEACRLAREVFHEFVAPLYSKEGVEEFLRYVDPAPMATRAASNHVTLLAEDAGQLLGVIELRDFNHVSLLFVRRGAQGKGVARRLLREALRLIRENRPAMDAVSVHSSPNAVAAYEKLGFRAQEPEKVTRGIRYVPMILSLRRDDDGQSPPAAEA